MNEILEAMALYQNGISGIAVKSTLNWYWLIVGLQAQDYPVHLVNTVAVKQYDEMKYRGDESDVRHLARKRVQLVQQQCADHYDRIVGNAALYRGTR